MTLGLQIGRLRVLSTPVAERLFRSSRAGATIRAQPIKRFKAPIRARASGSTWLMANISHSAVTYYSFIDVKGAALEFSEQFAGAGNTLVDDVLVYDYNSVSVGVELAFNKLLAEMIPYVGLICEYAHSPAPDGDHNGSLGGVKIGRRKMSKGGQGQAKCLYRRLERDAWPDVFIDSDFLSGSRNGNRYEFVASYLVIKNVELGADSYHSEQRDGDADQAPLQFVCNITYF